MEPTIQNRDQVFNLPIEQLRQVLPRVLEIWVDPSCSEAFIEAYADRLRNRWGNHDPTEVGKGWKPDQRTWFDAGLVDATITLSQNVDRSNASAVFSALCALECLVPPANLIERHLIFDQLVSKNFAEICIDIATNNPFWLLRKGAMTWLRIMASQLFLGGTLNPQQTSDLIETLCTWVLTGTDRVAEELLNPRYTWQISNILQRSRVPPRSARKIGKRLFGSTQGELMLTAFALLCRDPPPTRQFILEMLQYKPNIIDLLLDIANSPRTPWTPESQMDSVACETLILLLRFSFDSIPHLTFPLEGALKAESEANHKASISALEIFLSRPNWRNKLLGIWKKNEGESLDDILRLTSRVVTDYHAEQVPDKKGLQNIFEGRGTSRICTLRLIANLSHSDLLKDQDLISLLRPAYLGSQKVKQEIDGTSLEEELRAFERTEEKCHVPMVIIETGGFVHPPGHIANESTTGPIAFLSLLIRIAKRGILHEIQHWNQLPPGTDSSVGLQQVKQMTNTDIIKRILTLVPKRLAARDIIGARLIRQDKDPNFCRSAYLPAAELSAALVVFDEVSGGKWSANVKGARKDLVLNLCKVAELSMRAKDYETALGFASEASARARKSSSEPIPRVVWEENRKNVAEARRRISTDRLL